jgi:23S rRNA pseudouridine1911/1915/1917 synthase
LKKRREYSFVSAEKGRVDKVAAASLSIPRTVFSLDTLEILINGKKGKKSSTVNEGDRVELSYDEEIFEGLESEDIPLDIIYEDDDILVINKAQGMTVHPGAGCPNGTLANALLGLYGDDFSTSDDSTRPGIVHRLDRDTSGVMVIAKTREAHQNLSEQFSSHTNEKYYTAIAKGFFPRTAGTIDSRITRDKNNRKKFTVTEKKSEGKDALTKYRVISQNMDYALLRVRIYTGRTHQIRVHLLSIGHPVLGDSVYSRRDGEYPDATLMLHASRIVFNHPRTGERMVFRSPLPERFLDIMKKEGLSSDETEDTEIDK